MAKQPEAVSPRDVEAGVREHYETPALYDYEYRRRRQDVRFYCQIAAELAEARDGQRATRILELACGSGRVTAPLARAGHSVVGLDLSPAMLCGARARIDRLGRAARARVSLLCGDMCQFALGERFPVIIAAFNSFEHLYTRVEMSACLARVRDHLAPGGSLVFDVQNPNLRWLARDPTKRWGRTRFTDPETGERLVYSTNHDYDPISQIAVIRLHYEALDGSRPARVVRLSQRKFFPAELEALLAGSGFAISAKYGDFDGSPLCGDCPAQVLVCRAKAGPAAAGEPGDTGGGDHSIAAAVGIARDGTSLYYVRQGRVFRQPREPDSEPQLVADPGIAIDVEYVYYLDARGDIARARRSNRS